MTYRTWLRGLSTVELLRLVDDVDRESKRRLDESNLALSELEVKDRRCPKCGYYANTHSDLCGVWPRGLAS